MSDESPGDTPPTAPLAQSCWRCGLEYARELRRCLHCAAKSRETFVEPPPDSSGTPTDESRALRATMIAFFALLSSSVVWGWCLWFGPPLDDSEQQMGMAIVEAIDTVICFGLLMWVGRQPGPSVDLYWRVGVWFSAGPVLVLLLVLNVLWSQFLQWLLPPVAIEQPQAMTTLRITLNCIQPAIVEEFFFRYCAIGALRSVTGTHAAVWTTAAMFAIAHLYNPLGMPYLFLIGVVWGYYRLAGGLALPILMHFVHNFAVLLYEANG